MTYSVVDSYDKSAKNTAFGEDGGEAVIPGSTPRFVTEGRSSTRIFQASRLDPAIRSAGGDARVMLKEFAAANQDSPVGRASRAGTSSG